MGFWKNAGKIVHKGIKNTAHYLKKAGHIGSYVGKGMQLAAPIAYAFGNVPLAMALEEGGLEVGQVSNKVTNAGRGVDVAERVGSAFVGAFRGKGKLNMKKAQRDLYQAGKDWKGAKDGVMTTLPTVGKSVYRAYQGPSRKSVVRAYQETPNQIVLNNTGYRRRSRADCTPGYDCPSSEPPVSKRTRRMELVNRI